MANNTQQVQEPQSVSIDKNSEYGVQESLVLSILSQVTLTFKGFDFDMQKFRLVWIDQATQESRDEILTLTIKNKVGKYVFTQVWLENFFDNNFNGRSANFNIEIFHLNAAFKIVVDNTIAVSLLDNAIVTPIQGLVPLPFNNPFAEIGIRGAVPQETPEGSDELSWKSGYTEPYQRPTNRDGKWIKMGQYNQILHDITKSALILQDNLSILAGYINDEVDIKLNEVKDKIDNQLSKPPANAVLLKGNQNVAGLKNFQGINVNNYKNTPAAVANLEWCNGMPIKKIYKAEAFRVNTNYTITPKNTAYSVGLGSAAPNYTLSFFLDSKVIFKSRSYRENMGFFIGSNKQVFKATQENFTTNMFYLYGN